jgi:hypothetical protein
MASNGNKGWTELAQPSDFCKKFNLYCISDTEILPEVNRRISSNQEYKVIISILDSTEDEIRHKVVRSVKIFSC